MIAFIRLYALKLCLWAWSHRRFLLPSSRRPHADEEAFSSTMPDRVLAITRPTPASSSIWDMPVLDALIRDHRGDALQPAQNEAGAFVKLRRVDQDDEFISLVNQLLFGLDQQWIALHQPERTQPLRAHEHAARIEIAGHVIIEGAEDDVLLAVDRAAREHHGVLRVLEQMLGDRKGIGEHLHAAIGEKMHHLEWSWCRH